MKYRHIAEGVPLPIADNREFVIELEEGDDPVEIAFKLAKCAIVMSRSSGGFSTVAFILGRLQGPDDPIITEREEAELRERAANGRLEIEYWKGLMVNLLLSISGRTIKINMPAWADRCVDQDRDYSQISVGTLKELSVLLEKVSTS